MSNSLGLHDPSLPRVFKLSNEEKAKEEFDAFLSEHSSLLMLEEFPDSDIYTASANKMCLDGLSDQAVLWIKDEALINILKEELSSKVQVFDSSVDFSKVQAIAFKRFKTEVCHLILKQPTDSKHRMSSRNIAKAFAATLSVNNNETPA